MDYSLSINIDYARHEHATFTSLTLAQRAGEDQAPPVVTPWLENEDALKKQEFANAQPSEPSTKTGRLATFYTGFDKKGNFFYIHSESPVRTSGFVPNKP